MRIEFSIRVWHGTMDPHRISLLLGLEATQFYAAGTPRVTPTGRALGSLHRESLWMLDIDVPDGATVADAIDKANALMAPKHVEIGSLARDGARIEYFVGLFVDKPHTDLLSPVLLKSCADLSAHLILNIYPPDCQKAPP